MFDLLSIYVGGFSSFCPSSLKNISFFRKIYLFKDIIEIINNLTQNLFFYLYIVIDIFCSCCSEFIPILLINKFFSNIIKRVVIE